MDTDGSSHAAPAVDLEGPARALREAVEGAATILIASEPVRDADAFGAELALRGFLEASFGIAPTREAARTGRGPKFVSVVNEHGAPARLAFLEGASFARAPVAADRERGYDLGILVDGGVERCGPEVRALFEGCRRRACIDHHRQGSRARYDVVVLDPARASTTELLAFLLETEAWRGVALTRPVAEAIYLGLLADTGSFIYSLTTPATHRLAARLLEAGTRQSLIAENVLLESTFEDLELQGRVLGTLARELGGKLVTAHATLDMLGGRALHTVGFDRVTTTLAFVKGGRVTLFLRQQSAEAWKLSLRSRGEVDVAALARSLDPEGGGHARAAGGLLHGTLEAVRARCVEAIRRALEAAAKGP